GDRAMVRELAGAARRRNGQRYGGGHRAAAGHRATAGDGAAELRRSASAHARRGGRSRQRQAVMQQADRRGGIEPGVALG
ncbi:MAG: hypothetical protein ACK56I_06880, partial [bacterium]